MGILAGAFQGRVPIVIPAVHLDAVRLPTQHMWMYMDGLIPQGLVPGKNIIITARVGGLHPTRRGKILERAVGLIHTPTRSVSIAPKPITWMSTHGLRIRVLVPRPRSRPNNVS